MAAGGTKRGGKKRGELIENRIIVWDIGDSRRLFARGYYGKPIGMPKPKIEEIDVPLVLDLIEGLYLLEGGELSITRKGGGAGPGGRRGEVEVTAGDLREICGREYHDADRKYLVYKSFRDRGYVVNPGIKFGCDFAVYEKGPGIDHAPYLVQVYGRGQPITSTGIVLAGRLATTVRKQFILAVPGPRGGVDFLALDWWRA